MLPIDTEKKKRQSVNMYVKGAQGAKGYETKWLKQEVKEAIPNHSVVEGRQASLYKRRR